MKSDDKWSKTLLRKSTECLGSAANWIAHNDSAGDGHSAKEIAGYTSTKLVADLWNVDAKLVAIIVAAFRLELGLKVGGA